MYLFFSELKKKMMNKLKMSCSIIGINIIIFVNKELLFYINYYFFQYRFRELVWVNVYFLHVIKEESSIANIESYKRFYYQKSIL